MDDAETCPECHVFGAHTLSCSQRQAVTPRPAENDEAAIQAYIDKRVGLTRKRLNVQAAIGVVVFGWLMKVNYDELGATPFGWAFLITEAFIIAIARQVEPMVGILAPIVYLAAWVHTNAMLSEKQRLAREQRLSESIR